MDYAQEQADELEALTSIFADDLEGELHISAVACCAQPCRRRDRTMPTSLLCATSTPPAAEVRDSIPSGWSPMGTVWRVVVTPQAEDGEEMEIPSEPVAVGSWVCDASGHGQQLLCMCSSIAAVLATCASPRCLLHPQLPQSKWRLCLRTRRRTRRRRRC